MNECCNTTTVTVTVTAKKKVVRDTYFRVKNIRRKPGLGYTNYIRRERGA